MNAMKSLCSTRNAAAGAGSIVLLGQTLKRLIVIAYGTKDNQVSGGPKWLDADRFDINAKAAGAVGDPQLLAMLQTLLADRFHLVMHHEEKVASLYVLVAAKTGLKIHPVEGGINSMRAGRGRISARGITMAKVADTLSRLISDPISDLTGAQGVFDIQLEWSTDGDATDTMSALSAAMQDQLGLKLELRKVPVDFVVIDNAEKPAEN
jgi:uncharacterized protein (TIGR03435 family)